MLRLPAILLAISLISPAAEAQVERRELPPIPGAPAEEEAPPSSEPLQLQPPAPQQLQPPPSLAPQQPEPVPGGGSQASPLPLDLWQAVDTAALQKLLAGVSFPSPSPALTHLIAGILAQGESSDAGQIAMRAEALDKAGQVEKEIAVLRKAADAGEPGAGALLAVALLEAGRQDEACALALDPPPAQVNANSKAARAGFLVPAYCAAAKGDAAGASLALQLGRDRGVDAPVAFAVVDKLNKSSTKTLSAPKSTDALDYVFLKLTDYKFSPDLAGKASPGLLLLAARDEETAPELRVTAAEKAAGENVIGGEALARAYGEAAAKLPKSASSAPALRAKLFAALDAAPAKIRAESIDALIVSGRDLGFELAMAEALAPSARSLAQEPEAASFAETGLRIAALAGDSDAAWTWSDQGGDKLKRWKLLLAAMDPSDARAEAALADGSELAKGGVPGPLLHRLVTVLDALDYEVPIPLWDEASKSPQPSDGFLPETGLLTQLKEASDRGDVVRTAFLAAAVLGPKGPGDANLLALGDAVRALKRAGLEQEARRVGFEALYARWPRGGKH
jgi:hypothetical protein